MPQQQHDNQYSLSSVSDSSLVNMVVAISTHILDTTRGRAADKISVKLYAQEKDDQWTLVGEGKTNIDGRFCVGDLTPTESRIFKYRFEVEEHFQKFNTDAFYPFIEIVFRVAPSEIKYHVPLLLNPFGYSTYRGT